MSKVLTFSRYYPSYHPRKGQLTFFVEKIWKGLTTTLGFSEPVYFFDEFQGLGSVISGEAFNNVKPKYHTIRAGNRFKEGDYFSPRVWGDDINPKSGRSGAYHSKQIIIAPDIKVAKVWDIEIIAAFWSNITINGKMITYKNETDLHTNDGLSELDFSAWFNKLPFKGQIICWNPNIDY